MPRITTTVLLLLATACPARGQVQRDFNSRLSGNPSVYSRAIHQPYEPPITAAKIRTAIDDAVMYLRSRQTPDGAIEEGYRQGGGTALAALAILAAGGNPAGDDQLRKALDWLAALEPNDTYVRAIRANVWEYALRKVPYDERIRSLLKTDFEWLLAALGDREGWRYTMQSQDWDNSCTQYGVLGIWAAARAGFHPPEEFWDTMSRHFRGCQNQDGGWGYTAGAGSSANMATAGLASMFLVFDMYHGKTYYCSDSPRSFTSGEAAEVLDSIERGMSWLGSAGGNKADGYYLYGIERTGVASGRKYIGGEDWFADGAAAVLAYQQSHGSVPLGQWGGPVISTSFCTLFLVYGGAPVGIEKLQYGDGQDWNLNPRDLANLSKHLWSAYERPINWQTVSIDAGADQFEAPILSISGSEAIDFSEEQMLTIRRYILGGGTVLAEPSDHSVEFTRSIERLFEEMFPRHRYPTWSLKRLTADHEIFTVIKQDWKTLPKLRAASDGSRVFFILSDDYMSADWQMNHTDTDAFKLATNLLFYATDLGALEGKYASILPATEPAPSRDEVITVARAKYAGDASCPNDWDAAAVCWDAFGPYAVHVTGFGLEEVGPVDIRKDQLGDVRLLHMTGRRPVALSADERIALKEYVDAGGTILVDAYAGSPEFAATALAQLETIFGKLHPLPADSLLAEGRFSGGVDLSARIHFKLPARRLLRNRGQATDGQKLLVANVGSRPAVLFSEFDLSAALAGIENYRSAGYKPDSARKIVGNLLAFLAVN